MRVLALDLGLKTTDWCEVAHGQVVGRGRVNSILELESVLGPERPPARVGFEACREAWHVYDLLRAWGNDAVIFDTTRVRAMGVGSHGRKNDRMDAEVLAIALERGYAALSHVLSVPARLLREALERHRALVETRKRLVTHARGLARGRGIQLPACATEDFASNLRRAELPAFLSELIEPMLAPLEIVNLQLTKVDLHIQQLLEESPDPLLERLASVPGVSVVSAAAFVSVIDDVHRFRSASQVVAYVGLCPSERSSGGKQRLGAITKRGNAYLRWILVQSAWCILRTRSQDELVTWAHAVAKRRGRMRAAVAVARRLIGILFALWRDGTYYDGKTAHVDRLRWKTLAQGSAPADEEARQRTARLATLASNKIRRHQRALQRALEKTSNHLEVNSA